MDDLVQFLRDRLDEDELWATEASRDDGKETPKGGVHWHWVANSNDEEIAPDPRREKVVGSEAEETVSLRSREKWPTASGVGDLPQFALYADEVLSTVGGHIIRHDPARVLTEVESKRQIVNWVDRSRAFFRETNGTLTPAAYQVLGPLAAVYADHPDYNEAWRP
jgi:hypothetical protein